jgi:hypothetical protein
MYLSDGRNGSGSYHLTNYSDKNVNFSRDLTANDPETYQDDSNWWDRWLHLVATTDGNNSQLYIDGSQVTDSRLKESNPYPTGVGQDLTIGTRYNFQSSFNGYISVYRLYDAVLTPAQVSTNYNSEKKYYQ